MKLEVLMRAGQSHVGGGGGSCWRAEFILGGRVLQNRVFRMDGDF